MEVLILNNIMFSIVRSVMHTLFAVVSQYYIKEIENIENN